MAFPRVAGTQFAVPHGRERLMALGRNKFHANKGGGESIGNYNEEGTFVPRVYNVLYFFTFLFFISFVGNLHAELKFTVFYYEYPPYSSQT